MSYKTIKVRFQEQFCFLQLYRPQAENTINEELVYECHQVLDICEDSVTCIILEGLPEVFCFGVDFQDIYERMGSDNQTIQDPKPLYDLWLKFASGPYITISHVRGKVNAGGMGFVASSDIALASLDAQFSLSELLYGLFPACVLPFLIRRIGFQKSHYLTLTTKPISAEKAKAWGVVDDCNEASETLLRKHLLRLRYVSKHGILKYKKYMNQLYDALNQFQSYALASNMEGFEDVEVKKNISKYIEEKKFPWEN